MSVYSSGTHLVGSGTFWELDFGLPLRTSSFPSFTSVSIFLATGESMATQYMSTLLSTVVAALHLAGHSLTGAREKQICLVFFRVLIRVVCEITHVSEN